MTQPAPPQSSAAIDGGRIGGKKIIRGCAEVTITWILSSGKQGKSVLHGNIGGSGVLSQPVIDQLAAAMATAFGTHLAPLFTTTSGVGQTFVRDLRLADQAALPGAAPGGFGTDLGKAVAPGSCVVVTLRTLLAGRANRGRVYVPGWSDVATAAPGSITSQVRTSLVGWMTDVRAAFSAAGMPLCIGQVARQAYTGRTGTLHPSRVDGTVLVSTHEVRDLVFDSQRRRAQI